MKVLFITNAGGPDYMSDMVFHGGKSILGTSFYETNKLSYMYDDFENKNSLYGRGFTMYGKIKKEQYSVLPGDVVNLISDKFFDKIIYGSIWRCDDYFELVSKIYNKEDIIIIDGEDEPIIKQNLKERGKYFKRELYNDEKNVYPINFVIPKDLVITDIKEKIKNVSDIIPNSNHKYSYDNEEDYYNEYSQSWFAHTHKKAGWDCLRHYEIMMNGCIPIFKDLENCPKNIMVNLPKNEIINFIKEGNNIDNNRYILEYTRNNLTTNNIINYILQ